MKRQGSQSRLFPLAEEILSTCLLFRTSDEVKQAYRIYHRWYMKNKLNCIFTSWEKKELTKLVFKVKEAIKRKKEVENKASDKDFLEAPLPRTIKKEGVGVSGQQLFYRSLKQGSKKAAKKLLSRSIGPLFAIYNQIQISKKMYPFKYDPRYQSKAAKRGGRTPPANIFNGMSKTAKLSYRGISLVKDIFLVPELAVTVTGLFTGYDKNKLADLFSTLDNSVKYGNLLGTPAKLKLDSLIDIKNCEDLQNKKSLNLVQREGRRVLDRFYRYIALSNIRTIKLINFLETTFLKPLEKEFKKSK